MSQGWKVFDMETEKRRLVEDPHFTDEEKAEILEYEDTVKGLLIHKVYIKLNPLFNLEDRNSKTMAKLLVLGEGELDELYGFIVAGDKTKGEIEDKISELVQR
jgi:hypothetical protein